jgi:TolB-like protein/DNA-binding winged helix-turn-helix (wHTH) protein
VAVTVFKFGDFKLDCDRFELYRAGRTLKLERKPMELLVLLAAKNGNLVTRSEIAEHLWDREVFVDTEHGINTAIRKIREVLNDDPVQSRFVQTVTGKGYRLIGSIEVSTDEPGQQSSQNRNRRVGDIPTTQPSAIATAEPEAPTQAAEPPNDQAPPQTHRRTWLIASAALALLLAILITRILQNRALHHAASQRITSIAVLPLDNLSGDPNQNYFADGMTDELTTMLAKNSTLRVVSRTSAMQYKGVHRPLPEIARELGVDGILEGSISRSGDKVHMTIQLIQAPTDTHLWAESYDRNAGNVVSLPGEAAQSIAKRLNSAAAQSSPQRYVNPEAHDAYLRGRYLWYAGMNEEGGRYFRKATELQPDYALGWAGLSMYYGQGLLQGNLDPRVASAADLDAARKAVQLDDSLPEAHLTYGVTIFFALWDFAQADQEIARAIELNPHYAEAIHMRAKFYGFIGRSQEAIELQKKAMELAPFDRPWALAEAYIDTRQYDAAIKDITQRYESIADDGTKEWILCNAYRRKGMLKEAAQEWEKGIPLWVNENDGISLATFQRAYRTGGYRALLEEQLAYFKQKSTKQYVSPVNFALQYAQLGQREQALSALEEAYRQRSPMLLWIQTDPAYDFLHSDPRYRAIIKGLGIPPTY